MRPRYIKRFVLNSEPTQMQTCKRSLLLASPALTPDVSLSSVDPSTLVLEPNLLTPESSSESTPDPINEPPKKRIRKNAKTEEEKAVRAEERALRNRRAAQESRDRKKQQLKVLEQNNEQLRLENKLLREQLSVLEERLNLMEAEVKLESESNLDGSEQLEGVAQTHYPAAVMSCDLQCQVLPPTWNSPFSCPTLISTSKCIPIKGILSTYSPPQSTPLSCRLHSMSSFNFLHCSMMSILQMGWTLWNPQFEFCATYHSLNIGSLDTGAKTTIEETYRSAVSAGCVMVRVLELKASRKGSLGIGYIGDSNLCVKPHLFHRENRS